MLLSNGCVWHNYVKALHQCNSTILATIISTATNYIVSVSNNIQQWKGAILFIWLFQVLAGIFIFGEAVSLLWWCGFSFIVIGLVLIVQDENKVVIDDKKES